jgi:HSP20 family protein
MVKKLKPENVQATEESGNNEEKDIFNQEGELVVDVFETGTDFVVSAAIAGVQIKDMDISLEKDMMIIKGNRTDPHDHPEKKYFYQECYWGNFSRSVIVPVDIDSESFEADLKDGILTVIMPKAAKAKTKKVKVRGI